MRGLVHRHKTDAKEIPTVAGPLPHVKTIDHFMSRDALMTLATTLGHLPNVVVESASAAIVANTAGPDRVTVDVPLIKILVVTMSAGVLTEVFQLMVVAAVVAMNIMQATETAWEIQGSMTEKAEMFSIKETSNKRLTTRNIKEPEELKL